MRPNALIALTVSPELFEPWQPARIHKRFRWRPDVFLPDSPYDLLQRVPATRVIVHRRLVDRYFPTFAYADRALYFDHLPGETAFDLTHYFDPVARDGLLLLRCADAFQNAAAIALYPILRYLGFREVYFLGMDMSLLGSLEYAALSALRTGPVRPQRMARVTR